MRHAEFIISDRDVTTQLGITIQTLSQLNRNGAKTKKASKQMFAGLMGLGRLGLPTSRLSGVRSNRLSYKPEETEEKKLIRGAYDHGL